jgi:RNA polymerase sigma-70 factor, ECF subfamily
MQETGDRVTSEGDTKPGEMRFSPQPKTGAPIGTQTQAQFALLSRAQFDQRLREARQSLWCIAAAVLGRPDRAEDVLQDAVVTALTKLSQFDPETSFSAWMGQIVRFTALNVRRNEVNRPMATGVDPDLAQSPDQPLQTPSVDAHGCIIPDQESFDDEVLSALDQLGETPRACLLLRTVRGLSYKEIARTLDLPEGTAMSHVHRARIALRKALSPGESGGAR